MSLCRQLYHEECEAAINKQINMELYASYTYQSMAAYFERDDVALPGFKKFFQESSDEEREHASKFITYQNKRGGRVILQQIEKPALDDWSSGLKALQTALELEKEVNKALLELHKIATNHEDAQLTDYLESEFLKEQVDSIKQITDYITNLKRGGPGLGEYLFDKHTLQA
ncbi:UNVERIFIED_CONTAM: hypothetical protein GTU68_058184 [Idotea baltica]|nr:hypothetical protein [Idotea baltica]